MARARSATPSIADLRDKLRPDEWRAEVGFSSDLQQTSEKMLRPGLADDQVAELVRKWTGAPKNQPCIFGRMAAASLESLFFCILRDEDLEKGDKHVADKIQEYRLGWKTAAALGISSGFIIVVASERVLWSRPDVHLREFAARIGMHYLQRELETNEVYHDDVFLDVPGKGTQIWRWLVGANYFSAQGDKRWWSDHRFPGGMAYSMNSVGHLIHSTILRKKTGLMAKSLPGGVDSIGAALTYAMLTIQNGSEMGEGTWLKELDAASRDDAPPMPYSTREAASAPSRKGLPFLWRMVSH